MKRSADPNSDNLKAEFRQKLENYKAAPSENLWDKIELSLDKEEAKVYKNRFRVYSWLAAACLALLLAFSALLVPQKWESFRNGSPELATNVANKKQPGVVKAGKETLVPAPANIAMQAQEHTPSEAPGVIKETPETNCETVGKSVSKVKSKASDIRNENSSGNNQLAYNSMAAPEQAAPEQSVAVASEPTVETAVPASAKNGIAKATDQVTTSPGLTVASAARSQAPGASVVAKPSSSRITKNENSGNVAEISETAKIGNVAAANGELETAKPTAVLAQQNSVTNQQENASTNLKSETASAAKAGEQKAEILAADMPKTETLTEASESGKKKEKTGGKISRWLVSANYAALAFNSGIKLGSKPYKIPEDNSLVSTMEKENLTAYQNAIQEYNEHTSGTYSQAVGLQVGFKLNDNWLLQTGFGYLNNHEETPATYSFMEQPGNSYPGTVAPNPDSGPQTAFENSVSNSFNPATTKVNQDAEYTAHYRYQFYNVPVTVRYQTAGQGLYYFAAGGGSVNWLSETSVQTEPEQAQPTAQMLPTQPNQRSDELNKTSFFRKTLLAVQLQTGLGYRFADHWQAELALTGNQFLKPLVKDETAAGASQRKARNYGALVSLGYSF